jgi:hypothetical protein
VPSDPSVRLGVGYTPAGRAIFRQPQKFLRVATGGSDTADGVTSPLATLDQAQKRIQADSLITEVMVQGQIPPMGGPWTVSGRGPDDPIVFRGMTPDANFHNLQMPSVPANNLAFVDIAVSGVRIVVPGTGLLFENVETKSSNDGYVIQGQTPPTHGGKMWTNVSWRFCRIHHNWRAGNQAQGIFFHGIADPLIEYCVFDCNGWSGIQPRASSQPDSGPQLRSHNAYCAMPSGPGTVRYNIFSRGSSHGIHLRNGGILAENIFLRNPIAWQFGFHYPSDGGKPDWGVVNGVVRRNIALGSDDIKLGTSGTTPRGVFGIIEHVDHLIVSGNVAALNGTSPSNDVFGWFGNGSLLNIEMRDNTAYDWAATPYRNPPALTESNNRYGMTAADLVDAQYPADLQTDSFINSLIASGGFKSKQQAAQLLSDTWNAIGA